MVVREDGTKWACHSCLKGHRVSGCTHTDRELILVPKKGRPVTQCQHCRQERKKRSAHVRCDCGEDGKPLHSREKCVHLREAEERQKTQGFFEHHDDDGEHAAATASTAQEQGCCCHHGGKCSCAVVKKEKTTLDGTLPHGKPAVQKPKLETTRSDGHITVFQNGHHRPVHRKNFAAHDGGMPYKLPMQRAHTDDDAVARFARRSVDSLSAEASSRATANAPPTSVPREPVRRMSKSEQASPRLTPLDTYTGTIPAAAFPSHDMAAFGMEQPNSGVSSATGSDSFAFEPMDPMSGVADSTFDPWCNFPSSEPASLPNNNPFGVWPTSSDSGNTAQPALTIASSGTVSEVDEPPHMEDYPFTMPPVEEDINDTSFDIAGAMLTDGNQNNRRSLPPDFFSSFDLAMPHTSGVQSQFNGMAGIAEDKHRLVQGGGQTYSPIANIPLSKRPGNVHRRTMGDFGVGSSGPTSVGRPSSQSVGNYNAPAEDLMRELFPDIDISGGNVNVSGANFSKATPDFPAMATSVPSGFSFGSPQGFTSQPWTDRSIMSPDENPNQAFNPGQGFPSNADNLTNWAL